MQNKKKIQIILGVLAFLLSGMIYLGMHQRQESHEVVTGHLTDTGTGQQGGSEDKSTEADGIQTAKVYIHVCGAVKKPGVYTFATEPHVIDVVEKAGGFTGRADPASVNLAESVADGTQLVIAEKDKKKRADEEQSSQKDASVFSDKVDLNTASQEELMTLSGIGESKAAQIVSYREANGRFQKIEDIMNISGIKEGVFNKIKDYITV